MRLPETETVRVRQYGLLIYNNVEVFKLNQSIQKQITDTSAMCTQTAWRDIETVGLT